MEVELKETAPAHRFGSVRLLFCCPATFAYLRGYLLPESVSHLAYLTVKNRGSLSVHACAGHTPESI